MLISMLLTNLRVVRPLLDRCVSDDNCWLNRGTTSHNHWVVIIVIPKPCHRRPIETLIYRFDLLDTLFHHATALRGWVHQPNPTLLGRLLMAFAPDYATLVQSQFLQSHDITPWDFRNVVWLKVGTQLSKLAFELQVRCLSSYLLDWRRSNINRLSWSFVILLT